MELWIERKSGGADVEKREEGECAKNFSLHIYTKTRKKMKKRNLS